MGEEGITSLVEVGVEEGGAGRLEVDPRVRDRRARFEILVPELGDLDGRDEHSGRLPWRRASPRRRGWRAEPKRWRPWMDRQNFFFVFLVESRLGTNAKYEKRKLQTVSGSRVG